jgi:hypothetical protein
MLVVRTSTCPRVQETDKKKARKARKSSKAGGMGTEISAMFRECGLDGPIEELRGYEIVPISFD